MPLCFQAFLFTLPLVMLACKPAVQLTPPVAGATAVQVALSGASVLIGAGDIARCDSPGDEATARLVDSVLRADSAAKVHDEVFTLGDNAYPGGTARDFALCFTPSWGDTAKLIMKNIRPSPGNHEHLSDMAAAYYKYFGSHAGSSSKGYYSYDVGAWHAIVLNSEMLVNAAFTAADKQAQEDWLTQDLKDHKAQCTVAYWHHPRFSSGWHGSDTRLDAIWRILYGAGVELVLNGHDHEYERFLPQTPDGVVDSLKGMTEIIVGTGGGDLRGFRSPIIAHSASRIQGHFGVLKVTLGAAEWRSAFLDVDGRLWDQTGGKCH
jgi:3',5'-cyclic AMP phosphodiesterase CpdA